MDVNVAPISILVSSKTSVSSSVPHRVVVGFDITNTSKNKPSDLNESPRSVLSRNVLENSVLRSPRSCLGSSLSGSQGNDITLASSLAGENENVYGNHHSQGVPNQQQFKIQTLQICFSNLFSAKDIKDRKSIFFTGYHPVIDTSAKSSKDFLDHCSFCESSLRGVDVFMYRDYQTFCSEECRYQKILLDEQHMEDQ